MGPGFDDRHNDPTIPGQPGAPHQQQPYSTAQFASGGQPDQARFGGAAYIPPPTFDQLRGSSGGPGGGKAWIAAVVAAVVVVGGAIAAVVVANLQSTDSSTQPSMVSALTTIASAHPPSNKTGGAAPAPAGADRHEASVIPGYQVVVSPDSDAAYDVPADWTVAPEGTISRYGEPPNAIVGKGYASEGKNYCPGSTRTISFLTGSKDDDSASAAIEVGTKLAVLAYPGSVGAPGAPLPLDSLDGTQHGMFVETRGAFAQATPGCATEYSIYTYATPIETGNFVMVIAADTGVPNAVDVPAALRIFSSIRPYAG